jgi:2-polyprenyl-3-methyl-5-hydroxy-6-metoxy-1,4-benzoquinol methylase
MNIKIDDDNIDVKDIMKQLKQNISKREYVDDILTNIESKQANHVNLTELESKIYHLNRIWNYSAHQPLSSHRKVVGKFVTFIKKVQRKLIKWYINPIVDKQVAFNAETVRIFNELHDTLNQTLQQIDIVNQEIKGIKGQKTESPAQIIQQINMLKQELDKINKENQEGNRNTEILENDKLQLEISALKTEVQILRDHLSLNNQTIEQLNRATRVATERMKRIERKSVMNQSQVSQDIDPDTVQVVNQGETEHYEFDYYLFEELYRGSRDEIKGRQKQYLKYFKESDYVLDLGCGRGEFTELLIEQGIKVTSVDMDEDMVLYCKERGFPIIKEDILSFLNRIEDNSVDGIFLGQVIEHLSPKQLVNLVNISYKKLKPTGHFIAETPNPQCLSIFAQSFYMDMTHVKPVHPYTAKFILESTGFSNVSINYMSPNDETLRLPKITLAGHEEESLMKFNESIEHWNNVIFGYQDYFIVGQK